MYLTGITISGAARIATWAITVIVTRRLAAWARIIRIAYPTAASIAITGAVFIIFITASIAIAGAFIVL